MPFQYQNGMLTRGEEAAEFFKQLSQGRIGG